MSNIHARVSALLATRGKAPDWTRNPTIQDNSDGLGPFVASWDVASLGARPTVADGFTASELGRA